MNALAVAWRLLQTAGVLALDRLSPRRADDLPFGLSQVSAAWLTKALAPEVAWEQHRLFAVYCWVAAAFTAAAGGGLQPPEIGRAALHRATRAVVELGSVALLEGALRS